jgi:hypothetical protein
MNKIEDYYNHLFYLFGSIPEYGIAVPLFIAIIAWNKLNKTAKVFFRYLLAYFIFYMLNQFFLWSVTKHYNIFWKPILTSLKIGDNLFFNGIYYLIDFIGIGLFYSKLINKYSKILKIATSILVIFQIINYFFIDGFRSFGFYGSIFSIIWVLVLSGYYLWFLANFPQNISLSRNFYFWISIALFVPTLCNSAIQILQSKTPIEEQLTYIKLGVTRIFILIAQLSLYIIAFTKAKYLKYL